MDADTVPTEATAAAAPPPAPRRPPAPPPPRLSLLGGFSLHNAGATAPGTSRRLVALVALHGPVSREEAAEALWPEAPRDRAAARLRTSLWRLRRCGGQPVLDSAGELLSLTPETVVDLHEWSTLATQVLERPDTAEAVTLAKLEPAGELLPGWYDDWVLRERERIRQLALHVLEVAAGHLLRIGRHAAALELALAAVRRDPSRESAHRLAIEVHLAEGNHGEAYRQYLCCAKVLATELGQPPSDRLRALIAAGGHTRRDRRAPGGVATFSDRSGAGSTPNSHHSRSRYAS